MTEILITLAASIAGTLGFSLLFRVSPRRLPLAVAGGLIACGIALALDNFGAGAFFSNAAAALVIMNYSELVARAVRCPTVVFLMPAIIPLVPGSSLYYAMRALIALNWDAFLTHIVATVEVGFGVAGGIVIGALFIRVVFKKPINKEVKQKR